MEKRVTIVETNHFKAKAEAELSREEYDALISLVASDPLVGTLIRGGNGLRKLRVAVGNKGKSGGARAIYYFHSDNMPVFMIDLFKKNQKASLTKAEANDLAALVDILLSNYGA